MSEEKKRFENRSGEKVNHRILKVKDVMKGDDGEISELIVSVERTDEEETTGTKLRAEDLTSIVTNMIKEIKENEA